MHQASDNRPPGPNHDAQVESLLLKGYVWSDILHLSMHERLFRPAG